ncbi:hypothetical protein EMIT0158MI4_60163 [Burkholderia ambifaria]
MIRTDTAGNALLNNSAFVDGKAGCLNLAELVGRRLVGGADTGVCEGPGHVAYSICSKWMSES